MPRLGDLELGSALRLRREIALLEPAATGGPKSMNVLAAEAERQGTSPGSVD